MTAAGRVGSDRTRDARALLERILAEAADEAEELPALLRACTEDIPLPADAHVIGEPVSVETFAWDGNTRRGLTAKCRVLGTEREITLRTRQSWDVAPGEVVTVRPRKRWSYAGHPYLSGEVVEHRIDVPALERSWSAPSSSTSAFSMDPGRALPFLGWTL